MPLGLAGVCELGRNTMTAHCYIRAFFIPRSF